MSIRYVNEIDTLNLATITKKTYIETYLDLEKG
jgi:hypothetical protein